MTIRYGDHNIVGNNIVISALFHTYFVVKQARVTLLRVTMAAFGQLPEATLMNQGESDEPLDSPRAVRVGLRAHADSTNTRTCPDE